MTQRIYQPFPPHISAAWHYLELMLRGAQDTGDDVEAFFDRICRQTAYISQLAQGDPMICTLLDAAYEFLREQCRGNNSGMEDGNTHEQTHTPLSA